MPKPRIFQKHGGWRIRLNEGNMLCHEGFEQALRRLDAHIERKRLESAGVGPYHSSINAVGLLGDQSEAYMSNSPYEFRYMTMKQRGDVVRRRVSAELLKKELKAGKRRLSILRKIAKAQEEIIEKFDIRNWAKNGGEGSA